MGRTYGLEYDCRRVHGRCRQAGRRQPPPPGTPAGCQLNHLRRLCLSQHGPGALDVGPGGSMARIGDPAVERLTQGIVRRIGRQPQLPVGGGLESRALGFRVVAHCAVVPSGPLAGCIEGDGTGPPIALVSSMQLSSTQSARYFDALASGPSPSPPRNCRPTSASAVCAKR